MKKFRLFPTLDLTAINSRRQKSKLNLPTCLLLLVVIGLIVSLLFMIYVNNTSTTADSTANDHENNSRRLHHVPSTTSSKIHHTPVNHVQTNLAKRVGLATTLSSKPTFESRRKLKTRSSTLLETCLDKLSTRCPKGGSMINDSTMLFPISALILQTLTNDSGAVGKTMSRREKTLRAYKIKSQMTDSFDTLLTNVISLNAVADRNDKNSKQLLQSFSMLLTQMSLSVKVIQIYLDVINRSSLDDFARVTALSCEIDTTTTANTTTSTISAMIRSLQKATSTMMDDTVTMFTSVSASVTNDRTILEDILTIFEDIIGAIVVVIEVLFAYISGALFIAVFGAWIFSNYLKYLIGFFISPLIPGPPIFFDDDGCFHDDEMHDDQWVPPIDVPVDDPPYIDLGGFIDLANPCSSKLDGFSSLLVDVGMTGDEIEQLEQCGTTFEAASTTTTSTKMRLRRRDKLFLKKLWTNTILKSDTIQNILQQLSSFQNTPSSELFVCEFKLATCGKKD